MNECVSFHVRCNTFPNFKQTSQKKQIAHTTVKVQDPKNLEVPSGRKYVFFHVCMHVNIKNITFIKIYLSIYLSIYI